LVDEYGPRGFKVLAFPCNQFGAQEPGTHEEIIEFVKQFDPKMPEKLDFFEKADVNGANAREVFSFLKRELPSKEGSDDIRWNFGTCYIYLAAAAVIRESNHRDFATNPILHCASPR
jgi:glutathione peroxidase-family protein